MPQVVLEVQTASALAISLAYQQEMFMPSKFQEKQRAVAVQDTENPKLLSVQDLYGKHLELAEAIQRMQSEKYHTDAELVRKLVLQRKFHCVSLNLPALARAIRTGDRFDERPGSDSE
jgi:hypothetical protein